MNSFANLGVSSAICSILSKQNITEPTQIQSQAIPVLLEKKAIDFHGQAQTGTGKTFAFGIPLIERIDPKNKAVQALVVAPTRELAQQICTSLEPLAKGSGVSITQIYGGMSMQAQIRTLKRGVHIVVGTPGRLNDHLSRGTLSLKKLETLVLDEADIMLDMGFKEEIDEIITFAPSKRNIWLFSATVKAGIKEIMKQHMRNTVSVSVSQKNLAAANTEQFFSIVSLRDRVTVLCRFIDVSPDFYGFVFCRTKIQTAEVAEKLNKLNYSAVALHGDMSQDQRNRMIDRFKKRKATILVATDVAARGIDIADVTHVINFSLPDDQEGYIHRVGRTGRAGKTGVAISFVSEGRAWRVKALVKRFKLDIKPLNIPNVQEIAHIYTQRAAQFVEKHGAKEVTNEHTQPLHELLVQLNPDAIRNTLVALLHEKFFKRIKGNKNITFTPASSVNLSKVQGEQEVAVFVGSDDGLTKKKLLEFIGKYTSFNKKLFTHIKVLKRRSYLKLDSEIDIAPLFACKGKKLCGRKVRVART